MPILLNALLCSIVGAIAAHLTYTSSNLFILGDVIRRGRHPVFDIVFFDGLGLFWGLVVGGACAAWFRSSGPWKAVLLGGGVTLAGIGVVGGAATASRYVALPRVPMIDGKEVELEFELRVPAGSDAAGVLPAHGELRSTGQGFDISNVGLFAGKVRVSEGRVVIPGRAQLRRAVRERRLDIYDGNVPWPHFMLSLPGNPTKADMDWTDWYPAANPTRGQQTMHGYQIRYRVQFDPDG